MKRNGFYGKAALVFLLLAALGALTFYLHQSHVRTTTATASSVTASSVAGNVVKRSPAANLLQPFGSKWGQAESGSAFAHFAEWAAKYMQASTEAKVALEEEGIELAKQRRAALAELIQSDPRRALELAAPMAVRRALPQPVVDLLEERVSERGTLGVLGVLIDKDEGPLIPSVIRNVTFADRQYHAFVYGRRFQQSTTANIPINGIAVPPWMAVNENPTRVLEPEEVEDFNRANKEAICPGSLKPSTINKTQVVLDVGGPEIPFCLAPHAQDYNSQLIKAEGGPSESGPQSSGPAESHLGLGRKNVILIRVDFPDLVGAPFSDAAGLTLLTNLNNYYTDASYGIMTVSAPGQGSDLTPTFRMTNSAAYYGTNNFYDPLRAEARARADEAGYNRTNYHFHVICIGPVPGFGWGGLGYVHGTGAWIRNTSSTGTTAHEIGHNLGLNHANYWDTASQSTIGAGSSVEYGDVFDTMGGGGSSRAYSARYRYYLNWLTNTDLLTFSTNGVYRIMAYDVTNSFGPRLIRIARSGGSNTNSYWLEFRQKSNSTPWQLNGAGLRWAGSSSQSSLLLDTTPGSPSGKDDSPIVVGRTFSDTGLGIHITPLTRVGTVPASLDIMINRGTFVGNLPPTVTLAAATTNAGVNVSLNFAAIASDPNGDTLAYYWDFGDNTFGTNGATASHAWPGAGEYLVRCTASDMKGGTASDSLIVRVGAPNVFRISGTVRASDNTPVHGVRVYVGSTRVTYTDGDGTYNLVGLPAGSYTVNASLENYSFTHPAFSNPVNVGPNANNIDFLGGPAGGKVLIPLVGSGAEWKYLDDGSNQGTNWIARDFNDLTWNQGLAQLGYGDNDEATVVRSNRLDGSRIITTYFRHRFVIDDPGDYATLTLGLMRDDGGVVYLNGHEILPRSNMAPPPAIITYTNRALAAVDSDNESTFFEMGVNVSYLVPGTNVIAVEIHQSSTTSSDISFDLYLNALSVTNLPRGVFLTSPSPNANFVAPADVFLSANASAGGAGSIVLVEFYEGDNKLGESDTRPYAMTWSDVPLGTYTLTARAIDNNGITLTSAPVNITVSALLFARGAAWKYNNANMDLGTAWRGTNYSDNSWAAGAGPLGNGDPHIVTPVNIGPSGGRYPTLYFRRSFVVPPSANYTDLLLRLLRDDGAVVYLNGTQILADGVTIPAAFSAYATQTVDNAAETIYVESTVPASALHSGSNILAVEVHQVNATSSDLGFDLELLGIGSTVAPPPELEIVRSGADVKISWPASASGWTLYSATSPSEINSWSVVNEPIVEIDDRNVVTLSPSEASVFYRLQKP